MTLRMAFLDLHANPLGQRAERRERRGNVGAIQNLNRRSGAQGGDGEAHRDAVIAVACHLTACKRRTGLAANAHGVFTRLAIHAQCAQPSCHDCETVAFLDAQFVQRAGPRLALGAGGGDKNNRELVNGNQPQFLGMLGMHGTYEANMAMHHADVLFAVGARFDDRVTGDVNKFCPHAEIIHVDIDPSSISKNVTVHIPIVGSVRAVLGEMLHQMGEETADPAHTADWWAQIAKWRAVDSLKYETDDERIKPQQVIETLYKLTGGRAIIASDVGQHQMWAAQYFPFHEPRRWINSGGLGTMGFGYPAAIGAKIARPEEDVYCITGDGSIQMMIQEMTTALQYQVPVKILCLNNGYLGMVRQWQEFFYGRRYSMSTMDVQPDFIKLAEAYGHSGVRIERPADLEQALRDIIAQKDKTIFVDIITDPGENVYPMIPAGGGQAEMLLGKSSRRNKDNDQDSDSQEMVLI